MSSDIEQKNWKIERFDEILAEKYDEIHIMYR